MTNITKRFYMLSVTNSTETLKGEVYHGSCEGVLMYVRYSDLLDSYVSELVDTWLHEGCAEVGDSITVHTHEDGELSNYKFDGETYTGTSVITLHSIDYTK